MSLIPMLYSDWWEDLDRPHRLFDQHFGLNVDPEDLLDYFEPKTNLMLYRPNRRGANRYHPFIRNIAKRSRSGTSTVQADKNKYLVTLDVQQFAPEEIKVKVVGRNVIVEAKHEEKEDEHGWISRQFIRKYMIPEQCDIDQVESHLSSDGVLAISCPRKEPLGIEKNEKVIKIQYTGQPAVKDREMSNGNEEMSMEQQAGDRMRDNQQQQQQRSQQHQQQLQQQQQQQMQQQMQQQQNPRGRKVTNVKVA